MYTKREYSFKMTLLWSQRGLLTGLLVATAAVLIHKIPGCQWVQIPWLPMGLIGTAVAFFIGFKNNASYDRTWEARKIWGGIVNDSRAFSAMVLSNISNLRNPEPLPVATIAKIQQTVIYRHLAWLKALQFQMHRPRAWEHDTQAFKPYYKLNGAAETAAQLDETLAALLPPEELTALSGLSNKAAQIQRLQSDALAGLCRQGLIDDLRHIEFQKFIALFYDNQGKSERIKNFPFPRQYASTAINLIRLFTFILPFGLLKTFDDMGPNMVWLTIPFSAIVNWVFVLMEMIGDHSENPFECSYNDVPLLSICRGIEIDLREMLGEKDIPKPVEAIDGFLL